LAINELLGSPQMRKRIGKRLKRKRRTHDAGSFHNLLMVALISSQPHKATRGVALVVVHHTFSKIEGIGCVGRKGVH